MAEADPATIPRDPAAEWADHLRRTRAAILEGLAEERCALVDVMALRHRADVGPVHLRAVIEALPALRRIDARRGLARLGLPERTPLGDLEDAEVASVLEVFGPGAR